VKYDDALWTWFLARTWKEGEWGYTSLTEDERDHLVACGIDHGKSDLPRIGTVTTPMGTFDPYRTVGAIYAGRWVCNCGMFGSGLFGSDHRRVTHCLTLAITEPYSLGDIIREVVEIGGEGQ
jgi:hypothetical protein